MENAKITIIEDSESLRGAATIFLEARGHTVVAQAATLDAALDLVDRIADNTLESDVIVLDGNLTPHTETGADARRIMERITERGVGSAVLGFSEKSMNDYGIEVTIDAGKSLAAVNKAISEL